jgi:hypothetical protein
MSIILEQIKKEKKRDLLKFHRQFLNRFLTTKLNLKHKVRNQILEYYDTKINEDNIEQHYNKHLTIFLNDLLT